MSKNESKEEEDEERRKKKTQDLNETNESRDLLTAH